MKLLSALLVLALTSVTRGSGHIPVVSGIVQATTTAGAVVNVAVGVRPRRPAGPKPVPIDDKEALLGMLLLLGVGHGHRAP